MTWGELPLLLKVLLGAGLGLQVLLLLIQWRQGRRLARIERHLAARKVGAAAEGLREQKAATKEQKRLFEEFLDEDPSRRQLPKKEQFEGFRQWRSERGLNWGADGEG